MQTLYLENQYADEIGKILLCYVEGTYYKGEMTTDLLNILEYHRLDMIYESVAFDMPNELYKHFENKKEKIKSIQKEYENELDCILKQLYKSEIKFVILKGWAVARSLYKQYHERYFGDVDILIDEKNISQIEKIMKNEGYVYGEIEDNNLKIASRDQVIFQRCYTHEIHKMIKKSGENYLKFDYNFLFSWKCFDDQEINKISLGKVYPYIAEMTWHNKKYQIFNDNMQFVHLCCHFVNEALYFLLDKGFKGGDPNEIKLFRLLDIVLLLDKINVLEVKKIADAFSCRDRIDYVIHIIKNVFGENYVNKNIKWDINVQEINYYYTKDGSKKEWPISLYSRLYNLDKRKEVCESLF